jgi:TatD DNase family protein
MIIDSHCHLHDPAFPDALDALREAQSLDVWGVIAVGCDVATNARNLQLAASAPNGVWACLGFHPDQDRLTDADLEAVERQLTEHHSRVVGLGEVGLPWYSLEGKADAAERMARGRARLDRLLALAARYDLAVSLHAPHGAAADALQALQRHRIERAVFHWHKASPEVTRDIVEAGYLVSVTPEVVYRERDRALVEQVPLESLLVESDAPWKYGGEFAGLESGPWLAARVAEEVGKLKGAPIEDTMFGLSTNACRLFHLAWA